MIECLAAFRYLIMFMIYIMAFAGMMSSNLELVGIGLMFIANLITSFFIFIDVLDISDVAKKFDPFVGVLIAGLAMNLVSSILIVITLRKLHQRAVKRGVPIKLS